MAGTERIELMAGTERIELMAGTELTELTELTGNERAEGDGGTGDKFNMDKGDPDRGCDDIDLRLLNGGRPADFLEILPADS